MKINGIKEIIILAMTFTGCILILTLLPYWVVQSSRHETTGERVYKKCLNETDYKETDKCKYIRQEP